MFALGIANDVCWYRLYLSKMMKPPRMISIEHQTCKFSIIWINNDIININQLIKQILRLKKNPRYMVSNFFKLACLNRMVALITKRIIPVVRKEQSEYIRQRFNKLTMTSCFFRQIAYFSSTNIIYILVQF